MIKETEVDLVEAAQMLDLPEEIVGRLAEDGTLKSRRCDDTMYFLRSSVETFIDRQIKEARSAAADDEAIAEGEHE